MGQIVHFKVVQCKLCKRWFASKWTWVWNEVPRCIASCVKINVQVTRQHKGETRCACITLSLFCGDLWRKTEKSWYNKNTRTKTRHVPYHMALLNDAFLKLHNLDVDLVGVTTVFRRWNNHPPSPQQCQWLQRQLTSHAANLSRDPGRLNQPSAVTNAILTSWWIRQFWLWWTGDGCQWKRYMDSSKVNPGFSERRQIFSVDFCR